MMNCKKLNFRSLIVTLVVLVFSANTAYSFNLKPIKEEVTDSIITTNVKAKLLKNPVLNPLHISASTKNGIVKLSGNIDSSVQLEEAVIEAGSVKNVKEVNIDNLKISGSDQPLQDAIVSANLKAKLIREDVVSIRDFVENNLSIEVKENSVYLSGNAKDKNQIKKIKWMAKTCKNIKYVHSNLQVA